MGQAGSADLFDGQSEISLSEGLDDPNHLEIAEQIKFYAQRIFRFFAIKRHGMPTDLLRRVDQFQPVGPI
jgi:hypothetical protein